jgi:hypothetical protein
LDEDAAGLLGDADDDDDEDVMGGVGFLGLSLIGCPVTADCSVCMDLYI